MSKVISMLITAVWLLICPSVQCDSSESIVDLSHPINSQTLHWITLRDYELNVTQNGTIRRGDSSYWVQSDEIHMATHTGTHLDAPCHFARGKWAVADIPLTHLVDRPAVVIDVVDQSMTTRDYELSVDDLKQWEKINGEIPDGAIILVRSGWARFWPKKLEYFGTDTKDVLLLHFPGVHSDAAQWLTDNRNIVGIGIDTASLDCGKCSEAKTHRILNAKNIYLLENIAQTIHELPSSGARLTLLPMKLEGASGVPVTVIAKIGKPVASHSVKTAILSLPVLSLTILSSIVTIKHIIS